MDQQIKTLKKHQSGSLRVQRIPVDEGGGLAKSGASLDIVIDARELRREQTT